MALLHLGIRKRLLDKVIWENLYTADSALVAHIQEDTQ